MPDSDRNNYGKIGLGLALLVAALIGYYIFSQASSSETAAQIEAQNRSADYSDAARIGVDPECAALELSETDCAEKAEQSARPDQRHEYDLEAQRTMAAWTRAMGLAAIIGMGVGIAGLGLIYTTFRETRRAADAGRRANQIAAETAERQLRPYVHVETINPSEPSHDTEFIEVTFKNFGQTPAQEPTISAGAIYIGKKVNAWPVMDKCTEIDRDIAPGHSQRSRIPLKAKWMADIIAKKGEVRIAIALDYAGFGIDDRERLLAKIHFTHQGPTVALRNKNSTTNNDTRHHEGD